MVMSGFNSGVRKITRRMLVPSSAVVGRFFFAASAFLFSSFLSNGISQEKGYYQEGKVYVRFVEGKVMLPKGESREVPVSLLFPQSQSKSGFNTSVFGMHESAYSLHLYNNPILARSFQLSFDSVSKMDELIKQLENDPRVELVERVPLDRPCMVPSPSGENVPVSTPVVAGVVAKEGETPNDPFYGTSDGLDYSWNLDMVGFKEIYGKYKASSDVKVAVVDGAIWADHEDLDIKPGNMIDVANTTPSSNPPDFVDQDEQGTPDQLSLAILWSHGTHCAGTLAAKTDNEKGIASIASGVTLLAARTALDDPEALTNNIDGVQWAVAKGAKVLSLSYTTYAFSETQKEIYESIVREGVTVVAAAGNDGHNTPAYPAAYEGVIAVGSLDSDGTQSTFSNYGDWVDVWAPGGYVRKNGSIVENNQILSTTFGISNYYADRDDLKGKYYDAMSGTSMATPLVASMVCLALSYYPEATPAEIEAALENSVKGTTVYAPAMMEYLEKNDPGKLVRNLQGIWNPFTGKVSLSWERPSVEGVTQYLISKENAWVGQTTDTTYTFDLEDQNSVVGVSAVYGTDTAGMKLASITIDTMVSYVARNPKAVWYSSEKKADFTWEAPEKGNPDKYVILESGKEYASVDGLEYSGVVEDTTLGYSVVALYGNDTSYAVSFSFELGTGNSDVMSVNSGFNVGVRVNRISKTVLLEVDREIEKIEIYNIQGIEIFRLQGDIREFRMPDVPGGIYMLRAFSKGEAKTVKFVL